MSDISHIVLSDGTSYNIKDEQARGNLLFSVQGTQISATSKWEGSIHIPDLIDGMIVAYHLPSDSVGSSSVTLNLTLDSQATGEIPVYLYGDVRLTSFVPSGSTLILQYVPIGSSISGGQPNLDNRWVVLHGLNPSTWNVI